MIEYRGINKNESGLTVRAKLNNMLADLITSSEGVNSVWTKIQDIVNDQTKLSKLTEDQYEILREQIYKSFDYTDITSADLITYINAMEGGVAGFVESPTYNPDIPLEKAATMVAVGPGTFVYFTDSSGTAITITGVQSFTIFYKGQNSSYWKYKTISLEIVVDNNLDGGNAFTKYGGSKVVDGGNAQTR